MLGEEHTLQHDFPEHLEVLKKLIDSDPDFASQNKTYNALDKEIRKLELNGAPIDDEAMHKLKHDRAEMKDHLYMWLQKAAG